MRNSDDAIVQWNGVCLDIDDQVLAEEALRRTSDKLARATERDPHYGPALALAAFFHAQLDVNGWTEDREGSRRTGIDLARRALQAAPDDPEVLGPTAFVLAWYGEDIDVAVGSAGTFVVDWVHVGHGGH